jgi:hypothetical protein
VRPQISIHLYKYKWQNRLFLAVAGLFSDSVVASIQSSHATNATAETTYMAVFLAATLLTVNC